MLHTVEAEINVDGSVRLLEPLPVTKTSRALVTLLNGQNGATEATGNADKLLRFLSEHRLSEAARPSAEEIEAHITEARDSWD